MLILFDVDGVLVHHRAYHLGLSRSIGYFSRRMGAGDHALTQAEIDEFEGQSVTVEWESCALSAAAVLLARLRAAPPADPRPASPGIAGFWQALDALGAAPTPTPRPDFTALARRVGAVTPPGGKPSLTMLPLLLAECQAEPWGALAAPLLRQLLADCYDINNSPATQVVQNFAVGHAGYRKSYGLTPHFEQAALLETEDSPLLQPAWRDRLLAERAAGRVHFTLYTARPSLPPVEVLEARRGYTPEAEIALHLIGLDSEGPERVPVIAVGKLEWVARRAGRNVLEWVKPSPVQALAGVAAAASGQELAAVEAALLVETGAALPELYQAGADRAVHVFEDSANSLRAVAHAVELLNAHGLGLRLTRHGIAPAGSPKSAALAQVADFVHPDVNAGLAMVLPEK
ncbi:MAG: hypothetical protein JNK29_18430 [Anaerolineales bacterium]|nr:hypothetical protein [Anaerolineales bacterium]